MIEIKSKNAERHILLATTDLKERGVVVPMQIAKEAVAMAEQELKDRAVDSYKAVCRTLFFGCDLERCDPSKCNGLLLFTQKLNEK